MNTILSRYRLRNAVIAGGLALVGALLVAAYVTSYRNSVTRGADLVSVYVAAHDIAAGTNGASIAGAGDLKQVSVLRRSVVPGAITNASQIAKLSAAQTIYSGEQITIRQFRAFVQQGPLSAISGNLRAIAIPGSANQLLAGVVKNGDHVDVLANVKYVVGGQTKTVSRYILRDLLVVYAPAASGGTSGTISNPGATNNSITLAVTDQQASKLFFTMQNASWSLVLRPVGKTSDSGNDLETMQNLVGDGLSPSQVSQATNGRGLGSVTNAG